MLAAFAWPSWSRREDRPEQVLNRVRDGLTEEVVGPLAMAQFLTVRSGFGQALSKQVLFPVLIGLPCGICPLVDTDSTFFLVEHQEPNGTFSR